MNSGRIILTVTAAVISGAVVSACGPGQSSVPALDEGQVTRGGELYQENCASCHRSDLSGDPDWKTRNDDGSYRPPPHDSSGHTWHHPDRVLIEIIRDGSDFPQSRMPSFGDKLSDEDIAAILEFFKANWGDQERAYQQQVNQQDQGQSLEP